MDEQKPESDKRTLRRWQKFLRVVYRLVIVLGLITLVLGTVLVVFTDIIPFSSLIFPLALTTIGIILARLEYALHKRLTQKS